jgi:hypothetical protein
VQRGEQRTDAGYLWIYLTPGLDLVFHMADGAAITTASTSVPSLQDGAWHHLAIVQDRRARSVGFFLDGVRVAQTEYVSPSLPVVRGGVWLGTYGGRVGAEYMFKGALDEVRWYNRSLTDAEVARLSGP